jgi:hypothetical protein
VRPHNVSLCRSRSLRYATLHPSHSHARLGAATRVHALHYLRSGFHLTRVGVPLIGMTLVLALGISACGSAGSSCFPAQNATLALLIAPPSNGWIALSADDLAALLIAIRSSLGKSASAAGAGVEVRQATTAGPVADLVKGAGELVELSYSGTVDVASDADDIETLGLEDGLVADITAESLSTLAPVLDAGADIAAIAALNSEELESYLSFTNTGADKLWTTVSSNSELNGQPYEPVLIIRPGEYLELVFSNLNLSSNINPDLSFVVSSLVAYGSTGIDGFPSLSECDGSGKYCLSDVTLNNVSTCGDVLSNTGGGGDDTVAVQGVNSCGGNAVSLSLSCQSTASSSGGLIGTWTSPPMTGLSTSPNAGVGLPVFQAIHIDISSISSDGSISGTYSFFGDGLLSPTNQGSLSGEFNGTTIRFDGANSGFIFTFSGLFQPSSSSTMTGSLTVGSTTSSVTLDEIN